MAQVTEKNENEQQTALTWDQLAELETRFADDEGSGYIKADSLTQATPSDAGYDTLLPVALGKRLYEAAISPGAGEPVP